MASRADCTSCSSWSAAAWSPRAWSALAAAKWSPAYRMRPAMSVGRPGGLGGAPEAVPVPAWLPPVPVPLTTACRASLSVPAPADRLR